MNTITRNTAAMTHELAAELHRIAGEEENNLQTNDSYMVQQLSHDATRIAVELTNYLNSRYDESNGETEVTGEAHQADARSQGPGSQEDVIAAHFEAASNHEAAAKCLRWAAPWNKGTDN